MCMCVNQARHNHAAFCVHKLCVRRLFLQHLQRTNLFDFLSVYQNRAILKIRTSRISRDNSSISNQQHTGTVTAGKLEPDTWGGYGTMVRLAGAGSVFTPDWLQVKFTTSTNVFEFVVPSGGYTAVPVRFTSGSNKFPNNTNDAKMTLRVSKDSPGLASIPGRGIPLLQSAGGINAANVRFEDVKAKYNGFFFKDADGNKYADAAAIAEAGKTAAQITQIWYRGPARPLTIIVR